MIKKTKSYYKRIFLVSLTLTLVITSLFIYFFKSVDEISKYGIKKDLKNYEVSESGELYNVPIDGFILMFLGVFFVTFIFIFILMFFLMTRFY